MGYKFSKSISIAIGFSMTMSHLNLRKLEIRSMQSVTREELVELEFPTSFIRLIRSANTLAPNSTSRTLICRFKHIVNLRINALEVELNVKVVANLMNNVGNSNTTNFSLVADCFTS